ncbi:MAG: hypothetical protein KatS3mg042_1523 [Rhodothermaceae bacterium]|nr:MAG: hypothetical protein KatS3mg042_1523 [Rhodothermaceae bacterium]
MAQGLFLVGTDRGVGKTLVGVGIVALLREMGVDATMMTPILTGGSVESATALLRQIGVNEPRRLLMPQTYETPAAPFVAAQVERRPVNLRLVLDAYHELRSQGKFVVVEGGGVLVPIARRYDMIDLLKDFEVPALIIGRSGRGTLNHCMLTQRMMLVMGIPPLGFVLNGYGQYGDGFAESINPDALRELAAPTPVLATLEWRPEYQTDVHAFIEALRQQDGLRALLKRLIRPEAADHDLTSGTPVAPGAAGP